MDLELKRSHLAGYDLIMDTAVCQEETLETIVPDACPDILRLIDTQGKIFLKNKVCLDGKVVLNGTARLTVLYHPDNGTGPCCLEVNIPFQTSLEDKNIRSGCFAVAELRVAGADTRTVNPRKIVTRVEIAVEVKVFSTSTTVLCTGAESGAEAIEQLLEEHRYFCISAVQEKQISFEDSLSIQTGRSEAAELINGMVELACNETKIIGNKMIFKGEALVQILYRTSSGELDVADFVLPLSQIAEVLGVGEEGKSDVKMCLTGAEFTLGDNGRTISVALSLLAQIIISEERSVKILNDAYSTSALVQTVRTPFCFQQCQVEGTGRQVVREIIETGLPIKSVIFSYCSIGRMAQKREGNECLLKAQIGITSLCITEDNELCAVSRSIEADCRIDIEAGNVCHFSCHCGNLTTTLTADGVEVKLTLMYPYRCMKDTQIVAVREASVEEFSSGTEERASIVLRILSAGEHLWDVAKKYRTTIDDILKVNGLESEQLDEGTLLLIPRKR